MTKQTNIRSYYDKQQTNGNNNILYATILLSYSLHTFTTQSLSSLAHSIPINIK